MQDDQDWIGLFESIGVTLTRALIVTHLVAVLVGFIIAKVF